MFRLNSNSTTAVKFKIITDDRYILLAGRYYNELRGESLQLQ